MSGAEFIAVAGVISSMIAIVDGIKQVVDAASEVEGLPKAFRQASNKLPLISDILEATKHNFGEGDVSGVEKSVALVVDDCKDKWEMLRELFDKVIPEEKASRVERYHKAVKTLGKGGKVEILMKGILEDIQLLATIKAMTTMNIERVIKTVTAVQEEKVTKAITDVVAWPSSVPDDLFQDRSYTNFNYGTGQYISQGGAEQNNFQGEARQYHSGGGSLTINEAQAINNGIMNIYPQQNPKNDEAQACLNALFLTDPRDDRERLIQRKGSRVDGTCEWIKTNALYNSWLCSHSQLLWLSGGPGKGKTMLSIFLAEELERTAKRSENTLLLQYFCDNKDEKRNTAVNIVRGLLFQLLQLRASLLDFILPSFRIQKESLFTDSSFETLWRIFETMLRDPVLGTVYCIIDGLDECDEASSEVLLQKFAALFKMSNESSACHINLIVVSRDLPRFIPEILSSFPRIRLDPDAETEVNDDIQRFINEKVDELSAHMQYPQPLRSYVKKVFRNRAQGTFLWVGVVAKALGRYEAIDVEKALDLFPPGLDELYARILLQIDVDQREIAAKILRWVVLAVRPLTVSELSIAIETSTRHSVFDFSHDEVTRGQISYCGYFLTIKDDEVSLIHQSAKDYLLRETPDSNPELEAFRINKRVGNLEITRSCFDYLQNGALANGAFSLKEDISRVKDFPFISYAVLHWPEHARSLAWSDDVFDLSLPFYAKNSQVRESWLKTYGAAKKIRHGRLESFTLLHLASYLGILPLAENLLSKKGLINGLKRLRFINKKDDRGFTALQWAALEENNAIVRLLLEKGADIEARDKEGNQPLYYAVIMDNKDMVRLLLEKGADIEARNKEGNQALYYALVLNYKAMLRLLLDKGADVEAKDKLGNTALFNAVISEKEAIIRLLLEKGADVEAKNISGVTARELASIRGCNGILRLLNSH